MSLVTSGSCWCGSCGYSYTGEPAVKAICHCITCRRICGGTNTVNFAVPEGNFTVTKGALKHFSKEHEFGMMLAIFFCTECGTTLWKEATCDALKGMKLVQAGTLDNKKLLNEAIKVEMYTTERVPWLASLNGAAQVKLF